jgi:predicted  nucleic acid-binding Zn-ribbon protein
VLETAKKQIASKEGVLTNKKSELQKIIEDTEKEENHFKDISDGARQSLDERLLFSYDRIRNNYRNGLGVVPVVRDSCGGCFNAIPPQKQSEIKQHKKIIVCENCGRILVDEDLHVNVETK